MEEDSDLLRRYVLKALSSYDSRYKESRNFIMCKCKGCGDSKHSQRKTRGYFLKGNLKTNFRWTYMCHNGDCDYKDNGVLASNFLKEEFPEIYKEYFKEVFSNFISKKKETKAVVEEVVKPYDEKNDLKYFFPIESSSGRLFDLGKELCVRRKIPEQYWKKFYIATNGFYQGRMIIPFYDNTGKIYYFQGRTLIDSDRRYLNRKIGDKEIFGIDFIDRSKEVVVLEGPIDSMFIENAIAILGLSFSDKIKENIKGLKLYYLLDNDKDGKRNAKKLLRNGEYVFFWSKFLEDLGLKNEKIKDINDVVMKTNVEIFAFEDLRKYFSNDVFKEVLI